jgi:hypothetical protein
MSKDLIYLVECADGLPQMDKNGNRYMLPMVRQRCRAHLESSGPLRVVKIISQHERGGSWGCMVCGFVAKKGV